MREGYDQNNCGRGGTMGILQQIFGTNQRDEEFGSLEDRRVVCTPDPADTGDHVHVTYQGLLRDAGAKEVYLHYSFDGWSRPANTIPMQHWDNGDFVADVRADGTREMNLCFKDAVDNWDNNSGKNWSLRLR